MSEPQIVSLIDKYYSFVDVDTVKRAELKGQSGYRLDPDDANHREHIYFQLRDSGVHNIDAVIAFRVEGEQLLVVHPDGRVRARLEGRRMTQDALAQWLTLNAD